MTVSVPRQPLKCGRKHPSIPAVRCDRPYGHKGAHLDHDKGAYWQAAEGTPEKAAQS